MKFIAEVDIMPHKELLDPQGKTVAKNMKNIDIFCVEDVRIGKHITLTLEAESYEHAQEVVQTACQKLLANLIMESFRFHIQAIEEEKTAMEEIMTFEEMAAVEEMPKMDEPIEIEIEPSASTSTY